MVTRRKYDKEFKMEAVQETILMFIPKFVTNSQRPPLHCALSHPLAR
jgi:hypothetical protein